MSVVSEKRAQKPVLAKSMQERVVDRVREMTPEQRFKLMVSAGIYTADKRLTEKYRP